MGTQLACGATLSATREFAWVLNSLCGATLSAMWEFATVAWGLSSHFWRAFLFRGVKLHIDEVECARVK